MMKRIKRGVGLSVRGGGGGSRSRPRVLRETGHGPPGGASFMNMFYCFRHNTTRRRTGGTRRGRIIAREEPEGINPPRPTQKCSCSLFARMHIHIRICMCVSALWSHFRAEENRAGGSTGEIADGTFVDPRLRSRILHPGRRPDRRRLDEKSCF